MQPVLNLKDDDLKIILDNFILEKNNQSVHSIIYKISEYLDRKDKYNKDKEKLIKLKEELDYTFQKYVDIGKELNRLEEEFIKKY